MQASQKIVEFIKKAEGFSTVAYRPLPTDVWTLGYGFTYIHGERVKEGDTITKKEADAIILNLISLVAQDTFKNIKPGRNIPQHEFDAVVSLKYNIGSRMFNMAKTGKKFYSGDNISDRFEMWVYSGGNRIEGLVNRRNKERKIYDTGIYTE